MNIKGAQAVLLAAVVAAAGVFAVRQASAAPMDWLKGKLNAASAAKLSDTQVGAGLKEALTVGIERTIKLLGRTDGFFGDEAVKILMPESIRKAEPVLRRLGLGPQVDELVLSMNRAAEKAAPLSADIFASAITGMSFDDARTILNGGGSAATDYLQKAASDKILEAFRPAVGSVVREFGVAKKYDDLVGRMRGLPLVSKFAGNMDISNYVSSKALDGLFKVLAQQETQLRSNPAARTTGLLKQLFAQ